MQTKTKDNCPTIKPRLKITKQTEFNWLGFDIKPPASTMALALKYVQPMKPLTESSHFTLFYAQHELKADDFKEVLTMVEAAGLVEDDVSFKCYINVVEPEYGKEAFCCVDVVSEKAEKLREAIVKRFNLGPRPQLQMHVTLGSFDKK
jgi:hypothetical protein